MLKLVTLSLAAVVASSAACGRAADFTSGLPAGENAPTYTAEKCGGAEDGVKEGQKLCYTWRLGERPVAMVFAKADAANLASLVKQLDKLVADKKDAKLFAVVNLVAEKPDDLKEEAKKFVEKNELKNVALTVTKPESAKGWKINADADVTVMVYKDKKVTANHAAKSGGIDKKLIDAVLADASKATE